MNIIWYNQINKIMKQWEEKKLTHHRQDLKKAENLRNKYLYKIFLILLKYIPHTLALIDCMHNIFSYYEIELQPFSGYIGGVSLLTLLFMFMASYVFQFCIVHRLSLYYVIINNTLALIDMYVGIPVSDKQLLCIYLIITFIFILLFSYYHVKYNLKSIS